VQCDGICAGAASSELKEVLIEEDARKLDCLLMNVHSMQRIDALLEAVEVEEVAFQAGCQAAELRNLLASALAKPQSKLSNMHSRINKHLGATAPKLAAEVCISADAQCPVL